MKVFITLIFAVIFSCAQNKSSDSNIELESISINSNDSTITTAKDSVKSQNIDAKIKESFKNQDEFFVPPSLHSEDTTPSKPVVKKLPVEQINPSSPTKNDTTYYYFKDGSLSVKVAPRSEKQSIWIFSRNGELTYELENVLLSYSIHNDLFFDDNGALKKIITHTNPGASLYMFTTTTLFNGNNIPLQQIREKTPSSLEDYINNTYRWDINTKTWIQEITIPR